MKFKIETKKLAATLKALLAVGEKKTTIPILGNVLIDPAGRAVATNLEMALSLPLEADFGKAPRKVTAPLRKLSEFVSKLDAPEVAIEAMDNNWLKVAAGGARAKLVGMAADNFPVLPEPNGRPRTNLPLAALGKAIKRAAIAVSHEESRYTMNGALLEADGKVLRIVATDGHRLAIAEVECAEKVPPTLVPKEALAVIANLDGEIAQFSQDDAYLFLDAGGAVLSARKLTGNFPNYQSVMPKDLPITVKVQAAVLGAALGRAIPLGDSRSHAVKVTVEAGKLTLATASPEYGEFEEEVPCETAGVPKGGMKIGFNACYLSDALHVAEGELTLGFKDEVSAAQVETVDGFKYVIMPMRV